VPHESEGPPRGRISPEGAARRVDQWARYRRKLAHRGRGVAELERTVGGVVADIDERLARHDVVRVLELGCGYGTALLQLSARYGPRVELVGMNRRHGDGNAEILLRNAQERGIFGARLPDPHELPQLVYGDVAGGLPFPDERFDLVYSQVAWPYFGNKIGVLRDVMRVLRPGGLAKIDADETRDELPPEYGRLVEIWHDGRLVPFADYLDRYAMALAPAPEGHYLRFGKTERFGDDLVSVLEIDLSTLHADWDGIKCVYRLQAAPESSATADRET
jgi:SAM-dependent methyltransferase